MRHSICFEVDNIDFFSFLFDILFKEEKSYFFRFEHFREVKAPSLDGQESQSSVAFRWVDTF